MENEPKKQTTDLNRNKNVNSISDNIPNLFQNEPYKQTDQAKTETSTSNCISKESKSKKTITNKLKLNNQNTDLPQRNQRKRKKKPLEVSTKRVQKYRAKMTDEQWKGKRRKKDAGTVKHARLAKEEKKPEKKVEGRADVTKKDDWQFKSTWKLTCPQIVITTSCILTTPSMYLMNSIIPSHLQLQTWLINLKLLEYLKV